MEKTNERAAKASQQLTEIIHREWEQRLLEDPLFATATGDPRYNDKMPEVSAAAEKRRAASATNWLREIEQIDRDALGPADRLNYDIFTRDLQERLALYEFDAYLMPVSKLTGPHSYLPDLVLLTPFQTVRDYENYLARLNGYPAYLAGFIALMRAGISNGLLPPRPALDGIEHSFPDLVSDDPQRNIFYAPFKQFPASIPPRSQQDLAAAGRTVIANQVAPGFRALQNFLLTDYLPAARDTVGISALPNGEAYYQFLVRKFTTLDMTANQVHQVGLSEVARIRKEMDAVIASTGFQGEFQGFLAFLHSDPRFYVQNADDLMKEVALIMKRMDGELPRLFKVLPRTPYGMRETPAHIAPRSTSAYYFPATGDGRTAGFYYVNTYDLPSRPLYEYEALSFHEAVPGHHLQIALQQEMQEAPDFRRYLSLDAFIEGWALYAERLGLEVGFYQDPYRNFGRLVFEMWRACRLVVDTGLHVMGWTRQQAIDYMAEYTALSALNIANEVDRYIAWPGQALAYKIGELKIRYLREQAETALGSRFDLRAFHQIILEDGPIPLSLLEQKVERWIQEQPA